MSKPIVFEECYKCVAPKRHPGCQDHCPGYAAGLARHEKLKEAENADVEMRIYACDMYIRNKAIEAKRKQRHGSRKTFGYGHK